MVQTGWDRGSGTSLTITFGASVTAGHSLILTATYTKTDGTSIAAVTCSPSGRGTWVEDYDTDLGPNVVRTRTFHVVAATAGTTITVTFGSTVQAVVEAAELDVAIAATLTQPEAAASDLGAGADAEEHAAAVASARGRAFVWVADASRDLSHVHVVTKAADPFTEAENRARDYVATPSGFDTRLVLATAWFHASAPGTYGTTWTSSAAGSSHIWTTHAVAFQLIGEASALAGSAMGAGEAHAMLTAPHSSFVPASTFGLPERWFFAGQDLSNYAYLVTVVVGADAHPGLRGADPPYTALEGAQPLGKLPNSRTIPMKIYVFPANAAGGLTAATERAQARANLDALQALFAVRGQQQLVHVMPDGTARVAAAEVVGVQPLGGIPGVVYGLTVDFHLADPWFYGLTVSDGPRTISASPTTFDVIHPGNVPGRRIVLEAVGALAGLRWTNTRNGSVFEYLPAITAAERLVVNAATSEVRLNGASVLASHAHFGGRDFFRLEPGVNPLEVTATGTGGAVSLTFLPPYV